MKPVKGALYKVPQLLGGAAAGGELIAGQDDVEVLAYPRIGRSDGFVFLCFSLFVVIRFDHQVPTHPEYSHEHRLTWLTDR